MSSATHNIKQTDHNSFGVLVDDSGHKYLQKHRQSITCELKSSLTTNINRCNEDKNI